MHSLERVTAGTRLRRFRLSASLMTMLVAGVVYTWMQPAADRSSSRDPPVIAIEEFQVVGEELEPWIGTGLADEVERALRHRGAVTVRRSPLSTANSPGPANEAMTSRQLAAHAQRLQADFVLGGTVARVGSRSEVGIRLIRVRDAEQVWSGAFWRDAHRRRGLPDEVAAAVVAAVPP